MKSHITVILALATAAFVIGTSHLVADTPAPSGPQDIKNVGEGALDSIPEDTKSYLFARPEDVKWFQDAKFGVFIHWDPSCLKEAEISWGRKGPRPGISNIAKDGVPYEIYDNLYKQFNPVKFNADEWLQIIKDAGAKYLIFTVKHHGGFCMFDSAVTDFDIMSTPYGKDICKQLADACHKYGIKLFWYYSQPDWHHPDYLTPHHERYRKYVYDQLRELLTKYGKVDGVWFDCLNTKWRHWNTPEMVKMIRTLQPGILINSRWGWGLPGVKHNGDFDNPEQEIGKFQIDRPWESCMTMGRGWSWRGGGGLLSPEACIKTLVQCVGGGGNLALDCGPRPDGKIDPPEKANYLAMGKWLEKNGEAIYGTRGGPYKPGIYGVSCRKGDTVYLHIMASLSNTGPAKITLPAIPNKKVLEAKIIPTGTPVKVNVANGKMTLDLSNATLNGLDNIVALKLDGHASEVPVITPKETKIPVVKAEASSSYGKTMTPDALVSMKKGKFEAGIHRHKVWVARGGSGPPHWVQIEFEKPQKVGGLIIAEPSGRLLIRKFTVEYDDNGKWKELFSGGQMGTRFSLVFPPVTTKKFRLVILKHAPHDPGLARFNAYQAE